MMYQNKLETLTYVSVPLATFLPVTKVQFMIANNLEMQLSFVIVHC